MPNEKNTLEKRSIGDYLHLLSVPAGVLLLLLVIIDVLGRLFLGKNLAFGLTLQELLLMVIGYTSLGATWKTGQFINVDILVIRFSRNGQLWFSIIGILSSMVCTGILIWFGIGSTLRAFAGGARPTNMNMPLGFWKLFIPIALGVLFIELTYSLIVVIRQLLKKKGGVIND